MVVRHSFVFFFISLMSLALTGYALASGTVSGTIKFDGKAPHFRAIPMDADPICLSLHKEIVLPQTIVLGNGNTLGNVFVYVKSGLTQTDFPIPSEPIVIDQKGCNYFPHVLGIRVNQKVRILNPDGTLHNVHAMTKVNEEFNMAMPQFRKEAEKIFNKPEFMFALKCDVHPWMGAWIAVMSHPYFTVTQTDGKFEIKGLPNGTYEIEAWHEKLGTKTATITITDGATQTSDFTFAAPSQS
ncbi:MAG: carboxypeptidase regulatory-like domain-containing protein [Candidatus Omnitrophica bacterium]|nr:carboxypeptidase regulatory-like domain-containing protein [Candidatus Omnitrophota bacterium]